MEIRLKKIRDHFDLTQQEFADKTGLARRTVQIYEKDASSLTIAKAHEIAQIFNINIEWLLLGIGEMTKTFDCSIKTDRFQKNFDYETEELIEIIKQFEDKDAVFEINQNMLYIEKRSKASFEKARNIIIGLKEGTAIAIDQDYKQKVRKEKKEPNLPPVKERLKKAAG